MKKRNNFKDYESFENIEVKGVKILNCINPNESNIKDRKFNAVCLCGEARTVRQYDIAHRQKLRCKNCGWKSCGQYNRKEDAGLNKVYREYKKSAERRNYFFELDKEFFRKLTSSNCIYCNSEPKSKAFKIETRTQYIYNGIDRVDCNIGYIETNCVPCCQTCNFAKSTMGLDEFKTWIKKIYNNLFGV